MDFLKKVATEVATEVTNNSTSASESKSNNNQNQNQNQNNDSNKKDNNNNKENNNKENNTAVDGVAGVLFDKINSTLGGGKEGEKKEGTPIYCFFFCLFHHSSFQFIIRDLVSVMITDGLFINADILDKAIDLFQERVLKSGDQSNESAAEQAKDKIIADTIRSGYKNITGKDIPL